MSGIFGVAGMSRRFGATGSCEPGDVVAVRPEPENEYDRDAVVVLDAEQRRIGRIRRVHSAVLAELLRTNTVRVEQVRCHSVVLIPRLEVTIKVDFCGPRGLLESLLGSLQEA
jgi:hypothetical protein